MESAAELHEARVLRGRIEALAVERAREAALPAEQLKAIDEEITRLVTEYRRLLARQADRDYRQRRALWRREKARRPAACA